MVMGGEGLRILQRNRANRMCIERERRGGIYLKELAHRIVEAGKSEFTVG